jgi:hypothetical protein
MKKITQLVKVAMLSVAVLIASVGTTKAQYEVGTNVLNLGVGLGSTLLGGYSGSNVSQTPAIGLSFEHGTWELGDGVVSLGGYLGYKSIKDEYSWGSYTSTWKWTYTIIGVRGAYHFPLDNEKLDLYLGAMLSYNILNFKYTDTDPNYNSSYDWSGGYGSAAGFSAFGGVRYYLTDNIGLNAELGYGIAYLTLGLSFKF